MKLLLVDDDPDLLDLLAYALRRQGFQVVTAADGQEALACWQTEKPDLVVLDVNLPKVNGFEVCRRIRHASDTPVIMLTARGQEADVLRGLQLGADDYVTKPFSAKQLAARMQAVLRRAQRDRFRQPSSEIRAGDLLLDLQAHSVTNALTNEMFALTRLEFRILYLLAMNEGRVVPYSRLIEYAWGYYDESNSTLLKTHISHIRSKLGLHADAPGGIRAVVGVGYMLARAHHATGAPLPADTSVDEHVVDDHVA